MSPGHAERHRAQHIGWLRASVLGANDGIVSVASLVSGVAASHASSAQILIAGMAGLVGGALSMAAGEYVSVSSQADTERADLKRERSELANDRAAETEELAAIYRGRGLDSALALQVAEQMMAQDALTAHARDELGITELATARPLQAALSSAASFAAGAALPLAAAVLAPSSSVVPTVVLASLVCLALLGTLAARVGGAPALRAAARVTFWGAVAMLVTAGAGRWLGGAL
ncbi:MAG: VIT family protein [Gemmatimonadota bacterium]